MSDPAQRVNFRSGCHRGSSLHGAFNETHVLAITQAICEYRKSQRIHGPLYMGKDTHALSAPAFATVLEVLVANRVEVVIDRHGGCTPTPVVSHAILRHNLSRAAGHADGIILTASYHPPEDGGLKYNPPHGGPAGADITRWIQDRANRWLAADVRKVPRVAYGRALNSPSTHRHDYLESYVGDLDSVVDMGVISDAGIKIGVDPLGGASVALWHPIAERYNIDLEVVDEAIDPRFEFIPLDWDGKIRMDSASSYAMARLLRLKQRFDVAFGTDPDAERHGIVTRSMGLMKPNHYLVAAIDFLFTHRPGWRPDAAVGKSVVSSSLIDRVAAKVGRAIVEMPIGFKWFVPGLLDGSLGLGGDESAGASFLRRDGSVWATDKDGIIMGLLAAEILARTGLDPSELYTDLARRLGAPVFERIQTPATAEENAALRTLAPDDIRVSLLAGDPIEVVLASAPGAGMPIGGLKVVTAQGWFAVHPSDTDAVYELDAESFQGSDHLRRIQNEARELIRTALAGVMR
jgi:phosphoglucomutase